MSVSWRPAVCAQGTCLAPASAPAGQRRHFARSARSSPKPVSFSKAQQRARAPAIHNNKFNSANDPRLVGKNLRFADRKAKDLGTDVALKAFDEAAAAFANPTPIVAATILERGPIVMRAPEEWEREFLEFQEEVDDRFRKRYPDEFVERQLAFAAKLEAEAGGGDGFDAAKLATAAVDGDGGVYDQFYAMEAADDDDDNEQESEADFQPLPRRTHADKINDQKSMDRLLQERLVLLVQRASDGKWTLPQTVREEGETMVGAAERGLRDAWGDVLDVWYPGNAPMGHMLQVHDEATQSLTGCYGEKVFLYRAVIMKGKLQLGAEYSDFRWLHRDEASEYLEPEEFSYLHQVFGGDRATDGSALGGFEEEEE